MIFNKFFKVPKHKQFEFATRYYDPKKEELKLRIKNIKEEEKLLGEKIKYNLETFFEKKRKKSFSSRQKQQSNFRIAVIIFVLAILVYILLQ